MGVKSNNPANDKDKREKERELEVEFQKSGMNRADFNLMKRKALRENGDYVPQLPNKCDVVRTHFHLLNHM